MKASAALCAFLISTGALVACNQPTLEPTAVPSPVPTVDLASLPTCQTEETEALGLGLTEFASEAEMREALAGSMLFPDPATLPESTVYTTGYYNAAMQGAFKQSTMGLVYWIGDQSDGERSISIISLAQAYPFDDPREPHEKTTVRGGKRAYAFEPPFREGLHSLQWQEDCRIVSVIADLPADEVRRIAEGLDFPTETP